jgi:hypothetical protein
MGIRSNVTLTDAASTPVNRVYSPFKANGDSILYQDNTQEIAVGKNKLTITQKPVSATKRTNLIDWVLRCPILAVTAPTTSTGIQPAPTVDHTNQAQLTFTLHERATLQERKDILAQMRDLIDEAIVASQVQDLDFIW